LEAKEAVDAKEEREERKKRGEESEHPGLDRQNLHPGLNNSIPVWTFHPGLSFSSRFELFIPV
jgi:hypothetical protein